uniref:Uncharacterized protein n=1 Tax=Rhizophora mucronata TaxID=61149 RepID=A0A2P2PFN8_RHIMU
MDGSSTLLKSKNCFNYQNSSPKPKFLLHWISYRRCITIIFVTVVCWLC